MSGKGRAGSSVDVDVVVVGLGTMGSMALWQLAQVSGLRVLGIEQFGPAHTNGSFSGESRLYRAAAKEGRIYIPALLESRRMWQQLEAESGREILLPVGALSIGPAGLPELLATLEAIDEYELPHRVFDAAQLRTRYPQFAVRDDDIGVLDELGGGLRPEVAVATATARSVEQGADVMYHTEVLGISEETDGVTLVTSAGTIRAGQVVATAGSWTTRLLPELSALVHVEAYALTWFMPRHIEMFTPDRLPVFMRDLDGVHAFGAPSLDGYSIKICPRIEWPAVQHPSQVPNRISSQQLARVAEQAQAMVPDLVPGAVRWSVHHDSVTADHVPVIDRIGGGRITVAAGMSGNGFKFAPLYGRLLADLATEGSSWWQHPRFTLASHLAQGRAAA